MACQYQYQYRDVYVNLTLLGSTGIVAESQSRGTLRRNTILCEDAVCDDETAF